MRVVKTSLLLLLSVLFFQYGYAQDFEITGIQSARGFKRHITAGVGGVYQSFYDPAISNIRYGGIGVAPILGNTKRKGIYYSEIYLQGSIVNMDKEVAIEMMDSKVKVSKVQLDYRYMADFNLLGNDRIKTFIGGHIANQYCYKNAPKLGNNAQVHEYAASLGPSVMILREWLFLQRYSDVSWDLNFPLVAFCGRPPYLNRISSLEPDVTPTAGIFSNNIAGSVNNYMRINSRVAFGHVLTNSNVIRLAYNWDYYRMKVHTSTTHFTTHTVSLSFMFNY